jgi:hypothetical protein
MYTKQDYEDLQSLHYVYYECEAAMYTIDKKYRIMREIVGTKETFTLQTFLPDKWGQAMSAPDRSTWAIVRHAGYFPHPIHNGEKCSNIEEVLQVISHFD